MKGSNLAELVEGINKESKLVKDSNLSLFELLMVHHFQYNLSKCLDYIEDDKIRSPANKYKPVKEGEENKEYLGKIILSNGHKLLKTLEKQGLVDKRDIGQPIQIKTIGDFLNFLESSGKEDGAYIYESKSDSIYRVSKIKELAEGRFSNLLDRAGLSKLGQFLGIHDKSPNLVDILPSDFVHYGGIEGKYSHEELESMVRGKVGTRTRLSLDVPRRVSSLEVHGYIEKQSGYTELGFGKVIHTDKYGLVEEGFAITQNEFAKAHKGSEYLFGSEYVFNEDKGIVIIHRTYRRAKDGKIVSVLEGPVLINGQEISYGPKKPYIPQLSTL